MEQKSPDESGSSQNWKADMGVGYEYHGSASRRVFSTRLSSSPSRVGMTNSPADSRSVDSLAGSGWLSPAGFRLMLPQSPGLKVAISQRRYLLVGVSPSRVGIVISPANQRPLFPHRVRWWFFPQRYPQADRVQRRLFPQQGLPISWQHYYSPAGWRSECC